jgi:hypothetical protein
VRFSAADSGNRPSEEEAADGSPVDFRLIAGSGRSGTTWVLDCLADANGLRPVFEPLNPRLSPVADHFAHRFLEPAGTYGDLAEYLESVTRTGHRSIWTTYRARWSRLFPGPDHLISIAKLKLLKQRWSRFAASAPKLHLASFRRKALVKCIRANLALGWAVKVLGARTILVVRHPAAVVESKYRLSRVTDVWDPWPLIERFSRDTLLNERTSGIYERFWNRKLSRLEALTLAWIVENQYPIEHADELGYCVVHYENLVTRPELEWGRACAALALPVAPAAASTRVPSQQASIAQEATGEGMPAGWMRRLEDDDLRQIQGMLDITGFTHYHVGAAAPIRRS